MAEITTELSIDPIQFPYCVVCFFDTFDLSVFNPVSHNTLSFEDFKIVPLAEVRINRCGFKQKFWHCNECGNLFKDPNSVDIKVVIDHD